MKQADLKLKHNDVTNVNTPTQLGIVLPAGARPIDAQKKMIWAVSAGLLAIILATTVANTKNKVSSSESAEYSSMTNNGSSSRGLASVGSLGSSQTGSEILNKTLTDKLVRELQEGLERQQVARQPSALDKFTFEDLSGQYRINMENEKISVIELAPGSAKPLQIPDTLQFLKEHASFFNAESIQLQSSTTEDGFKVEEFKFKHSNHTESIYQAKIDSTGHLIRLSEVQ